MEEDALSEPLDSVPGAKPAQTGTEPLKVLVVDDDESTARMIRILIQRAFDAEVEIALDCASASDLFSSEVFELVTLDYQLPDGDGLNLLQEFKKSEDSPPVILVTGRGDEQVAARAFLLGASGYVIKDMRLNTMLAAAVHKALTEIALKKAEAAVQASEARLRTVMDTTLEGVAVIDSDMKITYANQAMADMLGLGGPQDLIGRSQYEFYFEEDLPEIKSMRVSEMAEREILELRLRKKDGSAMWSLAGVTTTLDEEGRFKSAFGMHTDITERKIAEEALRVEKDRAQLYLDTANVTLVALDAEGRIALINKKGQQLLGYQQPELLGKGFFDEFVPERERSSARSAFKGWISGEREIPEYFEHLVLTKSGEERLIGWHNSLLKSDDGSITGILGSGDDVTEKVKAQLELRQAAARAETLSRLSRELIDTGLDFEATLGVIARNVVELIGDGCFIALLSEDGRHLEPTSIEHIDREAGDLVKELAQYFHFSTSGNPVEESLSTGKSLFMPIVNQKQLKEVASHEFYPFIERYGITSIIVVPLRSKGKPIGIVTVQRGHQGKPYTENDLLLMEEIAYFAATRIESTRTHKQLQRELAIREQHQKELQRVNEELEGFAHTVSHDLQGPLATMGIRLAQMREELLESGTGWSTEKIASFIEPLRSKLNSCTSLVESVLELAESGPVPREISVVEVSDIVRDCINEKAREVEEKGIEVMVDPEMGRVVANPMHLFQLFSNLIGNAVIHNKAERPRIEIRHLDDSPEGAHRYLVRDNGEGIPESYMEKLFTPFFRAQGGGTVLGLAIVYKIVRAYSGRIKAYNDGGACFEFTIKDFKEY